MAVKLIGSPIVVNLGINKLRGKMVNSAINRVKSSQSRFYRWLGW